MAITDWPQAERPREKLLTHGASTLSDAELLAIFLRTGCMGLSAVDLARQLLSDFNGLREIFDADEKQFCRGKGLGQAKYTQLQAILEMTRRYLAESLSKDSVLSHPSHVQQFLLTKLRHKQREVFAALLLDSQNQLICYKEVFFGTVNRASIYPREIVKLALTYNACGVIFAHNHPSGVAKPSQADRDITKTLISALELVDIKTLDHFVVGDQEVFSFAEKGWL